MDRPEKCIIAYVLCVSVVVCCGVQLYYSTHPHAVEYPVSPGKILLYAGVESELTAYGGYYRVELDGEYYMIPEESVTLIPGEGEERLVLYREGLFPRYTLFGVCKYDRAELYVAPGHPMEARELAQDDD